MKKIMTITKKYRTEEIGFNILIEQPTPGYIQIPIYENTLNKNVPKDLFVIIPEQEFEEDMEILLPKRLGNDWGEACFLTYQALVVAHLEKFGRILHADLSRYIGEMILVMSSIGVEIQSPISISQRVNISNQILRATIKELDLPIDLPH
jgi:hypothetical protein